MRHQTALLSAEATSTSELISTPNPEEKPIKVMTYNIRHGVGIDDQLDLDRIIDTIQKYEPDIIALNEVDRLMPRSSMQKQDEMIAEQLGYHVVYGHNINFGAKYGNVLLSRYPIQSWTNHKLPQLKGKITEPRGLIEAQLDVNGKGLNVFVTHLSLIREERPAQIDYVVRKVEEANGPTILMGDFNEGASSEPMTKIADVLQDSATESYHTFATDDLKVRIDYIFVSDGLEVKSSTAVYSEASDHLPVVAEVIFQNE